MLLHVDNVLDAPTLEQCRGWLIGADWRDGRATAGHQSARAKQNRQLAEDDPVAKQLGRVIIDALSRSATFFAGALPRRIFPPLFNRYEGGDSFGMHVDNAVRYDRSIEPAEPIRTDLSATLFLSALEDYDGGELVIEDTFGTQEVKLAAGEMVVYPASSLHRVQPVTRGARIAAFFWVQSMVRDDGARRLLYEMDTAIRELTATGADGAALLRLTACYHNLLRRWAEL